LHAHTGSLAVGKSADFALWDVTDPAELIYRIGVNPCIERVFSGQSSDA
jgi:imidazolonepropionase